MKKLASTLPNMVLSLTGICLVVAALLGFMYKVTLEPIRQTEEKNKNAAIEEVVPNFDKLEESESLAPNDKDPVKLYRATKGEDLVGYAVETYTDNGFSGRITVMVGFDNTGKLIDYKVLQHAETPGLGDKMQTWFHNGKTQAEGGSNFQQMTNVTITPGKPLRVSKDGGEVDAITAATVSSRAFLDAINRAYKAIEDKVEPEKKNVAQN